jgi:hypothetical protein
MSKNHGVVYIKPGVVEVQDIADPKFEDPHGRKINHAVILKIVATNLWIGPAYGSRSHDRRLRDSCSVTRSPAR